jgi:hypothetical protein
MNQNSLLVPQAVWKSTWEGLRSRSDGLRESACVWGGQRSGSKETVTQVHFIDDLPGVRRHRLFHRTSREATTLLFRELRALGQAILADIHCHPGAWVGLSETDAAHPIEYRVGLVALVFPGFATGFPLLSRAGVHVYLGEGAWEELSARKANRRIRIV